MNVAADARSVVDAVMGVLRGAAAGRGSVYDAQAAEGAVAPYWVVYPISDVLSGTLASPAEDADRTVQVTAVGASRSQAAWASDVAEAALLGADHRSIEIGGRALRSPIRHAGGQGVRRDDNTGGDPLFYGVQLYVVPTTPA